MTSLRVWGDSLKSTASAGASNHSDLVDDEPQKHRLVDDASYGATKLWSSDKISGELNLKSATSHNHTLTSLSEKSYANLTDTPTIPSAHSDLNNDEIGKHVKLVASESSLSSISGENGQFAICYETGNRYTWENAVSKWRLIEGNRYLTAGLPVSGEYSIPRNIVVFDATLNTMKMWAGDAWTVCGVVINGTGTAPTASNYPPGTLFVQYTA